MTASAAKPKTIKLSIVNDGLVIFIYDVEHAVGITESGAAILEGYEPSVVREAEFLTLGRRGILVAYEVTQDDDIELDVIVGTSLTKEQRQHLDACESTELAWLHSPSGHLHVDSYSTLRVGSDVSHEQGSSLQVSPSHYSVCLYRCRGEGTDVLHLRPIKNRPTSPRPSWWPATDLSNAVTSPPEAVVKDGGCETFAKLIDESQTALNIDEHTADMFKLTPGDRLHVRIGDHEFFCVYMGADTTEYSRALSRIENCGKPIGAELHWVAGTDFHTTLLVCFHSDRFDTGSLPTDVWIPVHVDKAN